MQAGELRPPLVAMEKYSSNEVYFQMTELRSTLGFHFPRAHKKLV